MLETHTPSMHAELLNAAQLKGGFCRRGVGVSDTFNAVHMGDLEKKLLDFRFLKCLCF